MRHAAVERWSRGASRLHHVDARAKILATLAQLLAIAILPLRMALLVAGLLVLLTAWARLPVLGLAFRAAIVLRLQQFCFQASLG